MAEVNSSKKLTEHGISFSVHLFPNRNQPSESTIVPGADFYMDSMIDGRNPKKKSLPACFALSSIMNCVKQHVKAEKKLIELFI